MSFELSTTATITNLNIRKKGKKGAKEVAVDIKFLVAKIRYEEIVQLFGTNKVSDIARFWTNSDPAELSLPLINDFSSMARFGSGYQIDLLNHNTFTENIAKFRLRILTGHLIEMEFNVSIRDPEITLLSSLAHHMQDVIDIQITAPTELEFNQTEGANQ
jgi:hypothetical protein